MPPSFGQYQNEHTRRWAEKIASFDGFIVITPEYNHSTSGVLKNAIDYLFAEWNNKAIGFISYGAHGGVRAVEHLRVMAGELMMADVRAQVVLPFATEFENHSTFTPGDYNLPVLDTMLDQVVAWSQALAPLRAPQANEPAAPAGVLASDVIVHGPLGRIDGAEQYQASLSRIFALTGTLEFRKRWVDGGDVMTWFDLHPRGGSAPFSVAGWLHVEDGRISGVRVTFDLGRLLRAGDPGSSGS
nr:NAD(P)H-dependent oxidoreductase [Streptomyces sp. CRN 30]